jgi:hypothetical protein
MAALGKMGFDVKRFKACAEEWGSKEKIEEANNFCALKFMGKCACGTGEECNHSSKDGTGEFVSCEIQNAHGKTQCNGETSDWHHFFSSTMIINLKRRPERREYMAAMLRGIGVPEGKIQFFDAVDVKQWGTVPFTTRLRDILKIEPSTLFVAKEDCCTKRLADHTYKCDVSSCGLLASGLSHYASIKYWLDSTADAPKENPAVMIMEDGKLKVTIIHPNWSHYFLQMLVLRHGCFTKTPKTH